MKNLKWLLLLPLAGIMLSASCKKDPLDQLPPVTQEGQRTFGCLVNVKPFVHKYQIVNFGPPTLQSYYQHLNTSTAQGYFFHVSASKKNKGDAPLESIAINSNGLAVKEGGKYTLQNSPQLGEIYAAYNRIGVTKDDNFETKGSFKGELHITRLDETKQIVSGTFWFNAVNAQGEKVEVREGRFDMVYTK